MGKIRVVVLNKGKLEEEMIDNTLENLQSIVGGYIEIPYLCKVLSENNIDVIMNENGKYIDTYPSMLVIDKFKQEVLDIIMGNCIFVSHNKQGEIIGLNDEQIMIIKKELNQYAELSSNKDEMIKHIVRVLYV